MKIGVIADTHNLLRPEVEEKLQGTDLICHAGDISSRKVLDALARIAPVRAVRGNNDGDWAEDLPDSLDFAIGEDGPRVYMTHKKKDLPGDLSPYDLVICGHTHQYAQSCQGRTLLLNPGSCGPRRFYQPITMALLEVSGGQILVERIDIAHAAAQDGRDVRKEVETVVRETQKGRSVKEISGRFGLDEARTEQIARLYVTHPGVTVDGILTKMGL